MTQWDCGLLLMTLAVEIKKNKALALSDSLNTETVVGHSNSWRKNVRQGRGDYKGLKVRKMIGIGQPESP